MLRVKPLTFMHMAISRLLLSHMMMMMMVVMKMMMMMILCFASNSSGRLKMKGSVDN